jgi:hypothetical protein
MVTKRVHDKGRRRRGIALLCSSHFHQSFNNVGKYTVQLLGIRRGCPAWRQSVVVHRLHTTTEKSKRSGWYPVDKLNRRADFKTSKDQPFFAIEATQLFGTRDPGFVWEATATLAMVVPIRVVDAYAGGKGWLEVRIAGAVPVVNTMTEEFCACEFSLPATVGGACTSPLARCSRSFTHELSRCWPTFAFRSQ